MTEIQTNINLAETNSGDASNEVAAKLMETGKKQTEENRLKDMTRGEKPLTTAQVEAKIKEISPNNTKIQESIIGLSKMCEKGFLNLNRTEQEAVVKILAEDLPNFEMFKALQGADKNKFGDLGGLANADYVKKVLENPEMIKIIQKRIKDVLDGSKSDVEEMDLLKGEVADLFKDVGKVEQADSENSKKITELKKSVAEYESEMIENPSTQKLELSKGKQVLAIEDLQNEIGKARIDLNQFVKIQEMVMSGKPIEGNMNLKTPVIFNYAGKEFSFTRFDKLEEFKTDDEYNAILQDIETKKAFIKNNEETIEGHKGREKKIREDLVKREADVPRFEADKKAAKKKYEDKEKEKDIKETEGLKKNESLQVSVNQIAGDSYKELFIHYKKEHEGLITTGKGLAEVMSIKEDEERYFKTVRSKGVDILVPDEDKIKKDVKEIGSSKPGETVNDLGKKKIRGILDDNTVNIAVKEYFRTMVKETTVKGEKVLEVTNKEEFDKFAVDSMTRRLSIIAVEKPELLKNIFKQDEAFARAIYKDAVPKIIENIFKENKYAEAKKTLENAGVTGPNVEGLYDKIKNNWWILALILAAVGGVGLMASKN